MAIVSSIEQIGGTVRRMREERGMSRAELSARTGIGARTLYALETGESANFGLGKLLAVLEALGLKLSIDLEGVSPTPRGSLGAPRRQFDWDELGDVWKLDAGDGR